MSEQSTETAASARSPTVLADLAMLVTVTIWAINNVMVKTVIDTISPIVYVFFRFLFVCVLIFAWMAIRGGVPRIAREDWGRLLFTGIVGFAIYNSLFTVALKYTTAFSGAILFSLAPVVTMALAAALRIERARRVQWVGVAISSLGVAIYVGEKLRGNAPALGDGLSLLGVFAFASYTLAARPLGVRYGSLTVTAWSCAIGLAALTPFAVLPLRQQDWGVVGLDVWGVVLYSSALSMLVGYTLWGWAIQRAGVGRTAPYLYLSPVIAGIASLLVLDERFTLLKLVGAALVLAGVVVARSAAAWEWRARRAAAMREA